MVLFLKHSNGSGDRTRPTWGSRMHTVVVLTGCTARREGSWLAVRNCR